MISLASSIRRRLPSMHGPPQAPRSELGTLSAGLRRPLMPDHESRADYIRGVKALSNRPAGGRALCLDRRGAAMLRAYSRGTPLMTRRKSQPSRRAALRLMTMRERKISKYSITEPISVSMDISSVMVLRSGSTVSSVSCAA